jgi:hypothetical protein
VCLTLSAIFSGKNLNFAADKIFMIVSEGSGVQKLVDISRSVPWCEEVDVRRKSPREVGLHSGGKDISIL